MKNAKSLFWFMVIMDKGRNISSLHGKERIKKVIISFPSGERYYVSSSQGESILGLFNWVIILGRRGVECREFCYFSKGSRSLQAGISKGGAGGNAHVGELNKVVWLFRKLGQDAFIFSPIRGMVPKFHGFCFSNIRNLVCVLKGLPVPGALSQGAQDISLLRTNLDLNLLFNFYPQPACVFFLPP